MRRMLLMGVFMLLMTLESLCAQEVTAEVMAAFRQGNVAGLEPYLGSEVELVINERVIDANKEVVLQELVYFFDNQKVKSFEVNHKGQREDSGFIIGNLSTAKGAYRVNCFLRNENDILRIHQIRIDKK